MPLFKITLTGEVPSKKNLYRMGGGKFYQHQSVTDWVDDVYYQVRAQLYNGGSWKTVEYNIALRCDFYITHERDLDNMVTSVCDALQTAGVYKNDKQIGKIVACKFLRKKEQPRVDIWGERIP